MDFEKAKLFPCIVNVNVMSGQCPCRCVHCPVGIIAPKDRLSHFPKKSMGLGLFSRIVAEIALHKDSLLRIHSVGEPLLWNNLIGALDILRDFGVKSWLFTSAVTDNNSLLKQLCECISIIEISVNSINRNDYRNEKGIDAFDMVFDNICMMSEYIRNNNLRTRLLLSRVQTQNECNDEEFIKFWKEKNLANDVFVRSYHNYNNILDIRGSEGQKKPCLVHWARASIDCGGEMVCCFNELFKYYSNDVILGMLNENTSIAQIWNGEKLAAIRNCDMLGIFDALEFEIPCRDCKTCQPIGTMRETSEKQLTAILNSEGNFR